MKKIATLLLIILFTPLLFIACNDSTSTFNTNFIDITINKVYLIEHEQLPPTQPQNRIGIDLTIKNNHKFLMYYGSLNKYEIYNNQNNSLIYVHTFNGGDIKPLSEQTTIVNYTIVYSNDLETYPTFGDISNYSLHFYEYLSGKTYIYNFSNIENKEITIY
jgi:hypothetical protein